MPKKGERDHIWDTLEELFGTVPPGTNAHAKRNKAIKDLRLMEATADELRRAYRTFNVSYPNARCTDTALATHFPDLRPKKVQAPCSECGTGGGWHTTDCSSVTLRPADRIG